METFENLKRQIRRRSKASLLKFAIEESYRSYRLDGYSEIGKDDINPWELETLIHNLEIYGTNFNRLDATPADFSKCIKAVKEIFYSGVYESSNHKILQILSPLTYKQFPFQNSIKEDMARTLLLFDDDTVAYGKQLNAMFSEYFGLSPNEAINATYLLSLLFQFKKGKFSHIEELLNAISISKEFSEPNTLITVLGKLVIDADLIEGKFNKFALDVNVEREDLLPSFMHENPIVINKEGHLYVPIPNLLERYYSVQNTWVILKEIYKTKFTDSLGRKFEDYVFQQIETISGCKVKRLPESGGATDNRRCDFIVYDDSNLIYVEVKAVMAPLGFKTNSNHGNNHVVESLAEAFEQLETTAKDIAFWLPRFAGDKKNVQKIVITLDQLFLSNTNSFRSHFNLTENSIQIYSIRTLESLVQLDFQTLFSRLELIASNEEIRGNIEPSNFKDILNFNYRNQILYKKLDELKIFSAEIPSSSL